jgi:hypothetical protein
MLMIKGDPAPGAAPSEELLIAMGRYNEELQKAGVLLDLAGLLPGARQSRGLHRMSEQNVQICLPLDLAPGLDQPDAWHRTRT